MAYRGITPRTALSLKKLGITWVPEVGDQFLFVSEGRDVLKDKSIDLDYLNRFTISGYHQLSPELGGKLMFFGGHLAAKSNSCLLTETRCSCMNKDGFNPDLSVYSVASWEKAIWLPNLKQLIELIEGYGWKCKLSPSREYEGFYDVEAYKEYNGVLQADFTRTHRIVEEAFALVLLNIILRESQFLKTRSEEV